MALWSLFSVGLALLVALFFAWQALRRTALHERERSQWEKERVEGLRAATEDAAAQKRRLHGFDQVLSAGAATHRSHQTLGEAALAAVSDAGDADQLLFLLQDPQTFTFHPIAGRGVSPHLLKRFRVRAGEGALGTALLAGEAFTVLPAASAVGSDLTLSGPCLVAPLQVRGRPVAALLAARSAGPFAPEALTIIERILRQTAHTLETLEYAELWRGSRMQSVRALSAALEAKDASTHEHCSRTRALVRATARELRLPDVLIEQIEDGALLHDVGKIGITDAILSKPGPLTPEEYALIKRHPAIGYRLVEAIAGLRPAALIVLYHHEWFSGQGYPDGLAGQEIPLGARVVSVINAWDAMTSDRPYRAAMAKGAALAELRRQAGTQFDPKIVDTFIRVLERLERENIATTEAKTATGAPAAGAHA